MVNISLDEIHFFLIVFLLVYKEVIQDVLFVYFEIDGYYGQFFSDCLIDLLEFCLYYRKDVVLIALQLASVVKFHYLLILLLFDEISDKGCDTIQLIDALEGLNILAEDALKINIILLLGFRELVVCPYSLPEDASIHYHVLNGFLDVE